MSQETASQKIINQKIINVTLTVREEIDVLVFALDFEKYPDGLSVNLNDSSGQGDLKKVFSELLRQMLDSTITLEFFIAEEYSKELYKDVCTEYIEDLNREINNIYDQLHEATDL